MHEIKPDRDYAVLDFQVGLGPKHVAVELVLATERGFEQGVGEKVLVRFTPEMAKMLARHMGEASKAAALGAAPTAIKQ